MPSVINDPATTEAARRAWRSMVDDPARTVLATDFDGVLAPIVDDPEAARADEASIEALVRLAAVVSRVVIITGRPARTAVRLGRFDQTPGLERLIVLGQYGVERWDAESGRFDIPDEPPEIAALEAELPDLLADHGWSDAGVEHKGRALAVHTRRLGDPRRAFEELSGPVEVLATRHGLRVEPGKLVLEIRPSGMDKGEALHAVVAEHEPTTLWYAGDDLGDIPAFRAIHRLQDSGLTAAGIYSASDEQPALRELADLVVDGPTGFTGWLQSAADAVDGRD